MCAVWRRKESTARSSKKEGGCDDECVEFFHVDIVALQQRVMTQKKQVGMRVVQLVTYIPEWCAARGALATKSKEGRTTCVARPSRSGNRLLTFDGNAV